MVILTFDIEDWHLSYPSSQLEPRRWDNMEYRTERNTEIILDILENIHARATFFFLGYEVKKNRQLLQKVQKQGHELGFHSMWHIPPEYMGRKNFSRDLEEGLNLLRDTTGEKIQLYRAPLFSWNNKCEWLPEVLAEHGIKVDSSTVAGRRLGGTVVPNCPFVWEKSGVELVEFPLSISRFLHLNLRYSGSGFFRLLPSNLLTKLFSQGSYHMLYFHPRDFDSQVPSSPLLPWYRNWMNRVGNSSSKDKLVSLSQQFKLLTLGEAYNQFTKKIA